MAADPQDFLDSGGEAPHPLASNTDASQDFLDKGGDAPHPVKDKGKTRAPDREWTPADQAALEADPSAGEAALHALTGISSTLLGGFRYAMGADRRLSDEQRQRNQESLTYEPRTLGGKEASKALDTAGSYLGQREGQAAGPYVTDAATSLGLPASVAGFAGATAETLANVPQYVLPYATRGLGPKGTPEGAALPRELPAPTMDAQGRLTGPASDPVYTDAPAPQGLPFDVNDPHTQEALGIKPEKSERPEDRSTTPARTPEQQDAVKALFKRLRLKEVRTSAVTGDAQAAADDYDSTKYTDDPMGERMRPLIGNERQALIDAGNRIVDSTEARSGTGQTPRKQNGRLIAAPMDALQDHIENATTAAYEDAKVTHAGQILQFPKLEAALKDPALINEMIADNKEGFLRGAAAQLENLKKNNPGGLDPTNAEQYRQFLNRLWKNNPEGAGALKDALDEDVSDQIGTSKFEHARQLHQIGKTLFTDPKGVRQTFGKDKTGNRTTAYEDIPDKIMDMDSDQFNNVLNTLRMMPDDLQPAAQKAISVLQGHAVNRLVDAGSKTELQWNKKGVNAEIEDRGENLANLFRDRPDLAAQIKDIRDGGEALRFNSSYRGAHAQESNMVRMGVGKAAEAGGGLVGGAAGAYIAGPLGAGPGAAVGRAAGAKVAGRIDAAAARRAIERRVTKID